MTDLETPAPDESTKPESEVGYCFGFACASLHVSSPYTESISIKDGGTRRVCPECGLVTKAAIVRRYADPRWTDLNSVLRNLSRCQVMPLNVGERLWDSEIEPMWGWPTRYPQTLGTTGAGPDTFWTRAAFSAFVELP